MKAAKIEEGGQKALTNKVLTEAEKKDPKLDFLCGFEIIDNEFRMFLLEGLSNGAMRKLENVITRE